MSDTQDDYSTLMAADAAYILEKIQRLGLVDNGFNSKDDIVQRIILAQKKHQKASNNPYDTFAVGKSDTDAKCDSLRDILQILHEIFSKIPTKPLSEVLLEERLLQSDNILDEITTRVEALKNMERLVIVAGETNGGKSTFLNLILGEKILPTDVLHCTFAITKIKYSEVYSIETLDHSGIQTTHQCNGPDDARIKLKQFVAREDLKERLKGSDYEEITLGMPSKILKSGVTLVDTPGIGEMDKMDGVTVNYIKNVRASGFIYIIKSDTAGGVQEDTLLSFLRAIQEESKKDSVYKATDHQAALFVCNRWDKIHKDEEEMVKKDTLTKLDIVWPDFHPEQVHYFSSNKAQLHLDADPEFVTDKLNDLLLAINGLFRRTADTLIQRQYRWMQYSVNPASSHLCSMINQCIQSKEDLEEVFQTVAVKQGILKEKSIESSPEIMDNLTIFKARLKSEVRQVLSQIQVDRMDHYTQLTSILTEKFLQDSNNKARADEWIMHALVHHSHKMIQESGILEHLETEAKTMIERHMGLFQDQIKSIENLVKKRKLAGLSTFYATSASSTQSSASDSSDQPSLEMFENGLVVPPHMNTAIKNLLGKKRRTKGLPLLGYVKGKLMPAVHAGAERLSKNFGSSQRDIPTYVERRIKKHAKSMRENEEIIEEFADSYLQLIERYFQSALELIPRFIGVNNKLMEKILQHHMVFHANKEMMKTVMDELEIHRERLRGYRLLFMKDVELNTSGGDTSVQIKKSQLQDIVETIAKSFDSGFDDSGRRARRDGVRGFWTNMRNADINVEAKSLEAMIKTYITPMDTSTQLSEIASLRYLDHKYIAPFFGMTRIATSSEGTDVPEKITAFIFKGSLVSARVFRSNRMIQQKSFVNRFVHELMSGLEYIHRENMVHLELSLDTVMVKFETGTVQLCQQCKPRSIALPKDLSVPTNSSVCLSPAALRGNQYNAPDDVYAFAILLWELLFPDNLPYATQRGWPLTRFIHNVSPTEMLGPEICHLQTSQAVISVFNGVLLAEEGSECAAARSIKSIQEDLKKDPAFNVSTTGISRNRLSREYINGQGSEGPNRYTPVGVSQSTPNLFFGQVKRDTSTDAGFQSLLNKFEMLHVNSQGHTNKKVKAEKSNGRPRGSSDTRHDSTLGRSLTTGLQEVSQGATNVLRIVNFFSNDSFTKHQSLTQLHPSKDNTESNNASASESKTESNALPTSDTSQEHSAARSFSHYDVGRLKSRRLSVPDDCHLTVASLPSVRQFATSCGSSGLDVEVSTAEAFPPIVETELKPVDDDADEIEIDDLPTLCLSDYSFSQTEPEVCSKSTEL